MNTYLPAPWSELVARLHVGVEPLDALDPSRSPGRPPSRVAVLVERVPLPHPLPAHPDDGVGLPALHRSPTGRFALRFGARGTDAPDRIAIRIPIRITDPAQRYVPRRLWLPVPALDDVLAADDQPVKPPRSGRPVLFPGAARALAPGTTAVLGRVVRPGPAAEPVPWARVEAGPAGTGTVTWRAHGDRNGEFVLVVGALPRPAASATTGRIDLDVTVHGPPAPAPGDSVDSPTGSRGDPLWLLPLESVAALEAGDPVEAGTRIPLGHTRSVARTERLTRGRLLRPAPYVLP